jgi:hypothetical protein
MFLLALFFCGASAFGDEDCLSHNLVAEDSDLRIEILNQCPRMAFWRVCYQKARVGGELTDSGCVEGFNQEFERRRVDLDLQPAVSEWIREEVLAYGLAWDYAPEQISGDVEVLFGSCEQELTDYSRQVLSVRQSRARHEQELARRRKDGFAYPEAGADTSLTLGQCDELRASIDDIDEALAKLRRRVNVVQVGCGFEGFSPSTFGFPD